MFAFVFAAQEWEPDMSEVTDQKDVVSSLFSVASDDRGAMIGTGRGNGKWSNQACPTPLIQLNISPVTNLQGSQL